MFRKFNLKTSRATWKTFRRFRQFKPLCPVPSDFSKVDKVTICGGSNPIGQCLAFLLKEENIIRELAIYDIDNVRGLAMDLQHMNTRTKVRPNSGEYSLKNALRLSDIVVITDGLDRVILEDENLSLKQNAAMIYKYATRIASSCPEALVCIITPPINIMVPLFSEVMKVCNVYDPNKIFGVCSLAEMRANTIVAQYLGLDPSAVKVPIVGGVTPSTMVPILSHAKPYNEFSTAEIRKLVGAIVEVQEKCKKLNTIAPLSTAYSLSRFVLTLAAGLCTCNCAVQTAFVRSDVLPQVKYFASSIRTEVHGAVVNYGLPKIQEYELMLLGQALLILEKDYEKALSLFSELYQQATKEQVEDFYKNKPFISKTPCPPCPCLPTDVCHANSQDNSTTPPKPTSIPFARSCRPE